MVDGFGDLGGIDRIDLGEVAAHNDAAREQERARILPIARASNRRSTGNCPSPSPRENQSLYKGAMASTSGMYTCSTNFFAFFTSSRRKSMGSGLITASGSFGSMRGGHAADQEGLRMRIFSAQHRVDPDEILLPGQRFQIMRHRQQVHFGRQLDRPDVPSSRWRTDSTGRCRPLPLTRC